MRKLFISLFLLSAGSMTGQQYDWQWALAFGSEMGMNDAMHCVDASGYSYASASYYGAGVTFGTYSLINANPASEDIFLVKYDPDGNVQWAKGFGSTGTDRLLDSKCDSEGNLIVAGCTNSPSLMLDSYSITTVGGYDCFIAKIDSDGNILWVKSFGGASNDFIRPLDLDADNNIYVTGYYYSASLYFEDIILTNTGAPDAFLARFNPDGDVNWAIPVTGTAFSSELPGDISASDAGLCLWTGTYSSDIGVGSENLTAAGGNDAFVVLVNPDGVVQSAFAIQTSDYEVVSDVEFIDEEHYLMAGSFGSPSISIGSETLTNNGIEGSDVFVASAQTNGTIDWAFSAGGDDNDNGPLLAVIADGCFLAMGFESSSIDIGAYNFTNAGDDDFCVARLDMDGEVLWVEAIGGEGNDFAGRLDTDNSGNAFISGTFQSDELNFGDQAIQNNTEFGNLMFLAKISATPDAVASISSDETALIFPNPCQDVFYVQTNQQDIFSVCEVCSPDGRVIRTFAQRPDSGRFKIDSSQLSPGIYLLRIQSQHAMYSGLIRVE